MGGKVDPIRWGFILNRLPSRTNLSPEEINRLFKIKKPQRVIGGAKAAPPQVESGAEPTQGSQASDGLVTAQRHLLGTLFAEPGRWHQVQQTVHLEDFSDESCRKLAELYWNYQRNEGEPEFREFLSAVMDEQLKELAAAI